MTLDAGDYVIDIFLVFLALILYFIAIYYSLKVQSLLGRSAFWTLFIIGIFIFPVRRLLALLDLFGFWGSVSTGIFDVVNFVNLYILPLVVSFAFASGMYVLYKKLSSNTKRK